MSAIGSPNLLTRPRYSSVLAKYLNNSHEAAHIIVRNYTLLPSDLILVIQPEKMPFDTWMAWYVKTTAQQICKLLATDKQEDRREWFNLFVNRRGKGNERFWHKIKRRRITSRDQYEATEIQMLNLPVREGYVSDPDHYPNGMSSGNRPGIEHTGMEFPG